MATYAPRPTPPSGEDERPEEVDSPRLELEESVAFVTFDDSTRKHNILSGPVMNRLASIVTRLEEASSTGDVSAVVFRSSKEESFIAGADVDTIASIEDPDEAADRIREGQRLYERIEALTVPTIAAVQGVCLGGGTELALACRFRLASDHPSTRIALPEVQLGILPAWGGTTRLPRLIGLRRALDLLLTGRDVRPSKARRIGLVSRVIPYAAFGEAVRDFAKRAPKLPAGSGRKKTGWMSRALESTSAGRGLILRMARSRVLEKTGGHYPAPLKILELLRDHAGREPAESFAAEVRVGAELLTGSVCKNLIHIFKLRERARKRPAAEDDEHAPRPVDTMAVVGAGVMGGGIAQLAAYNGVRVRMKDIRAEAVSEGLRHARGMFDRLVDRRKLTRGEAAERMRLITGGLEYRGFASADLVIEAVVERLDVKRTVLGEVEKEVDARCVLATNTSSLSVDEMARSLDRPERFAGMHFFNPVHKMPLVEIVRGGRTDERTVATIHALTVRLGKVPVVCRDGAGFLVNRILGPYLNEAGWLLSEGASIETIDAAATDFGMPMGPIRLIDEIGIDIARHAGEALRDAFGGRMEPSPPLVRIGEIDRLGRKGGSGFYRYEDGREKGVDDEIYDLLAPAVPMERRAVSEREIRSRLVLAMINEAARALEDGIVDRAGDVDLAMVMGTGFPPFRGGLLRFADSIHARHLANRLQDLEGRLGQRFEPARLILELARSDRGFYEARG